MDSEDNEWLYVATTPDVLSIICSMQEPSDIEIVGNGKLILQCMQSLWSKSPHSNQNNYDY